MKDERISYYVIVKNFHEMRLRHRWRHSLDEITRATQDATFTLTSADKSTISHPELLGELQMAIKV